MELIVIKEQPPYKEQAGHAKIGICSLGGRQHTYRIDHNLLAYPQLFDWTEPPKPVEETQEFIVKSRRHFWEPTVTHKVKIKTKK